MAMTPDVDRDIDSAEIGPTDTGRTDLTRRKLLFLAGSAGALAACNLPAGAQGGGTTTPTAGPEMTIGLPERAPGRPPLPTLPAPSPTTTTPPTTTPPTEPPDPGPITDFATHVINRLSFGATEALRAEVSSIGVDAWIDRQLAPASIPDPEGDRVLQLFSSLSQTTKEVRDRGPGQTSGLDELRHSLTLRATRSTRQLNEVMVHFWNDHFNVAFLVTEDFFHHETDRTVARAHALGTFREMLLASARSPAMLHYLNNRSSDANSDLGVNENYARELLELHSLGIVDGEQVYDEADVRAVAMILSGWSLDDDLAFAYKPELHHGGAVSVLDGAFTVPAGSGYQHGVALIDFLARHPSTARHLALKLARRFVADEPPRSLVDSAAQVYLDNDTAIVPVLRHLFASEAFRTDRSAKIKRPFELLMSMFRTLGVAIPDRADGNENGVVTPWVISGALDEMGLEPFTWPAPDGPPDTATYWLAANSLLKRWRYAGQLSFGYLQPLQVDLPSLLPNPLPTTAGAVVDGLGRRILGVDTPAEERQALLDFLGRGTGDQISGPEIENRLPHLVGLLLAMPTFQYR